MLHEMGELEINEPLHGFLLTLGSWNQAEILKEALQVDIWRSRQSTLHNLRTPCESSMFLLFFPALDTGVALRGILFGQYLA
jgi:hypothetical protein